METILEDYTEMLYTAKERLNGIDHFTNPVEYERIKRKISSYRGYIDELKQRIKETRLAELKETYLKKMRAMSAIIEDTKTSEEEKIRFRIKVNCFKYLN
jgi:hypothetical protein